MQTPAEFDSIRCYEARDMQPVFEELLADPQFLAVLPHVCPDLPIDQLRARLYACPDILDFQRQFIYSLVYGIMDRASTGLSMDCTAVADRSVPYTFLSNHRDIVLDSALLSALLIENGFPTTAEVAIGDNLLIHPWIKHVVRLNKAFIVQRSLGLRETLVASQLMSRYMHFVVREKRDPIWIAQREGRAKDSDDRTQESVLKMIAMGGEGTPVESLKEMHIAPLTISYEYDPCDYLKAREFQLRRDNPDYRKTREDDLLNMRTGIYGFKGRVHYQVAPCINAWLDEYADLRKNEFFETVARRIDHDIFLGYRLYPNNYIAADRLSGNSDHSAHYTAADEERFEAYLQGQLDKVGLPAPDCAFLRERMLTMYANPLRNHEAARRSEV
ncbi:MAG: acyltransferase [Alloprevotella sp.]|nr:acyltransferase [Alloprevotella sp.]